LPKEGPDNDDFDGDLSLEMNSLPQEVKEEETEHILNDQMNVGGIPDKVCVNANGH
jgi:hypothetical protein